MPCIGSTTTPSTRRSWPHTRLHELGVVHALHPDPARPGGARGAGPRPSPSPTPTGPGPRARRAGGTSVAGAPVDAGTPPAAAGTPGGGRAGPPASPRARRRARPRRRTRSPGPRRRCRARRAPPGSPGARTIAGAVGAERARGSRASGAVGRLALGGHRAVLPRGRRAGRDTPSARDPPPSQPVTRNYARWSHSPARQACRRARALASLTPVPCASATFTVWSSAWLAGAAAPDDVLDALGPWAEAHDVVAADAGTALAHALLRTRARRPAR